MVKMVNPTFLSSEFKNLKFKNWFCNSVNFIIPPLSMEVEVGVSSYMCFCNMCVMRGGDFPHF